MRTSKQNYSSLLAAISRSVGVLRIASELTGGRSCSIRNLAGSSRAATLAALWTMGDISLAIVVPTDEDAFSMSADLGVLIGADVVATVLGARRRSALAAGGVVHHEQVDALMRVRAAERSVMVISAASLALRLPPVDTLASARMALERGATVNYDDLVTGLILAGFERADFVSKPGEIAVRGGIVDVFPAGWDNPLRLEFFGNTIESIREFEPLSQRSIREHANVSFISRVYHDEDNELTSSVIDHIPSHAIIVVDQPHAIHAELERLNVEYPQWDTRTVLTVNPISQADVEIHTGAQPPLAASIEALLQAITKHHAVGYSVIIGADGIQNVRRLRELCDAMAESLEDENASDVVAHVAIDNAMWLDQTLSEGFRWDECGVAVFTEHQIFGRQRAQQRTVRSESGFSLRELQQLHRGDYVVHEDKGIGRFEGLETIVINGSSVECVRLAFEGGDNLFVHLNYVHKLSKYTSEEGAVPKLSKLGSAEWDRRKARAKKRLKDIARDLIRLYAQRKSQPGYAYPADTVWQKEFEASFQYEDTPDQARATLEVKHDMETPSPMDRLVCGDVGFGKTEIAVRAAFKAVQSGRQVAVLVPTTILAEQHGVTFRDRLHRYPVRIDVLSRFRSREEQKDILARTEQGSADIVVGTHRLLSKDVRFKNLGLLIIDEEHRFGVAAKEKLRAMRANVDTLTLTATPIPRTLNFSLMGARDLSVIETPPRNRLPINTQIVQWDDEVLREALLRELERGGQAFVVTDRITDMEKLVMKIKMLVPTLRVAMAHGQMDSEHLEDVMEGFLERKFDVLIATKIIESGLDIPNANTMIIENSDNFGLAELYQLRGRVGRSNTQAYCYLLIPPPHTLSRTALRRLQALEEHTDLGSGFQLAMRDLEIRGAGNLLGGEQSGFIMSMGFELYQKILDEAVQELRHDEFADLFDDSKPMSDFTNEDVAVELDSDALLPRSYIPADTDRYEVYKRLYNAHNQREVDVVYNDLRDRFGVLPHEAEELLYAVRLRIAALPTGFTRVIMRNGVLRLDLPADTDLPWYEQVFKRVLEALNSMKNVRLVQNGKKLLIEAQIGHRDEAISVLERFSQAVQFSGSAIEEEL